MTAIIIPVHCHDFKENTINEELSTNDSVDEILSRPQLSPMTDQEGDNNDNNESDETTVMNAESPSSETTATSTDYFSFTPTNDASSSSTTTTTQYGGLNNMGNTCYLNSALQMLASLDEFGDSLNQVQYDSKLRESLVDVLTRLQHGETVRPSEFKNVVDERSSLFIGYRQQDAHEFLTTLLDLLDEDYKKATEKPNENEEEDAKTEATETEEGKEDSSEPVVSDDEMENEDSKTEAVDSNDQKDDKSVAETDVVPELLADDETMAENEESCAEAKPVVSEPISGDQEVEDETEDEAVHDSQEQDDGSYVVVEKEEEGEDDGRSSPFKKQKIEGGGSSTDDDEESTTISSFMNLQFSDIESLLHGDKEMSQPRASPSKEEEPKYKLVGGRMSTAGVQLTPFENGGGGSNMNREETPVPVKPSQLETPPDDDTPKQSPIDHSFATEVRVCLTCDSCKYRRSHTEKYLHLSLEIGDDCSSIEDGIRKFFAPEKREIKCEKCFFETAMQTTEITRLPRAMLFHLKRFIVNVSPDYTSISYSKDQSPVSFEEGLAFGEDSVLAEFLADDVALPEGSACYGIRSVVNHIGSSASCGHYTADGRRLYNNTGRQWTRFNDSMVFKITDREAVQDSSRTAYMVMYEVGA